MRRTFGTVGFATPIPAKDRRWKKVPESPHLERHSTSFGVETRCRECKMKTRGYNVRHLATCQHATPADART